jgi:hypothetical protein
VTEAKIEVYPRTPALDKISSVGFTYPKTALRGVLEVLNGWLKERERPVELTHFVVFHWPQLLKGNQTEEVSPYIPSIHFRL